MNRVRISTVAALALLAGCGGGGGGTASGTANLFVTDRFSDDYSQVWVRLHRVEIGDNRGFHTIFDDQTGRPINASALSTTARMIGAVNAPAGSFDKVRITIEDHVGLVAHDGSRLDDVGFDDSVTPAGTGLVSTTFPAAVAINPSQKSDIVVDIDLANFQLVGGHVRPSFRRADDVQFEHADKRAEMKGVVSNLTDNGFDLALANGGSIHVITTGASIFADDSTTATTLANGQRVEVEGAFDRPSNTVTAETIEIENHAQNQGNHELAHAYGTIASIDAAAGSFVVTLQSAEHFTPVAGTITVTTDAGTRFDARHGGSPTFASLAVGADVRVVGAFDPATNTVAASRVRLR